MKNEPIYVVFQRQLLKELNAENYGPGRKIPSERTLSEKFGVSRTTMRRAIEELVNKGKLERRGTSGTYIPEKLLGRPLSSDAPYSLSEIARMSGQEPGSKLIYFVKQKSNEFIAGKLDLEPGEEVITIQRLRTINDLPVCLELSHIPAKLVPGLSASDVVENSSLYSHIFERYNLELKILESVVSVTMLDDSEAELLDLKPNSPSLRFESLCTTDDGRPFEYLNSLNSTEHVCFRIQTPEVKDAGFMKNGVEFSLLEPNSTLN